MYRKLILFFGLFLFFIPELSAVPVYENWAHKSYGEIFKEVKSYELNLRAKNREHVQDEILSIQKFARREKDKFLELRAEIMWAYYLLGDSSYRPEAIDVFNKVIRKTKAKSEFRILHVIATEHLALYYHLDSKEYALSFEQYLEMAESLKDVSSLDYPDKVRAYLDFTHIFFRFKEYNTILSIFDIIDTIPENEYNSKDLANITNTKGLTYLKLKRYEEAKATFEKIFSFQFQKTKNLWSPIATSNIAKVHYLKKEYDIAIPMFRLGIDKALGRDDMGFAASDLFTLGDIYIAQNKLIRAKEVLDSSRLFIRLTKQEDRLIAYYPVMLKYYNQKGDKELVTKYMDSAIAAINLQNEEFNLIKLARAEQSIENKRSDLKIALLKIEKSKISNFKNLLIFLVVLLVLSFLVFYLKRQKRDLSQKLIFEQTQKELDKAYFKLALATQKARSFALTIAEKNELIAGFQQKFQHFDNTSIKEELRESTILTEEDWVKFQQLFEKAFPGFLERLKTAPENFTNSEVRLITLRKLGLSANEIAQIIGVSPNTIHVTKHRAKQKMDDRFDSLDSFIASF